MPTNIPHNVAVRISTECAKVLMNPLAWTKQYEDSVKNSFLEVLAARWSAAFNPPADGNYFSFFKISTMDAWQILYLHNLDLSTVQVLPMPVRAWRYQIKMIIQKLQKMIKWLKK